MTIRWNAVSMAGVLFMLAGGAGWAVSQSGPEQAPAAPAAEEKGDACCAGKAQGGGAHADCPMHKDGHAAHKDDPAHKDCPMHKKKGAAATEKAGHKCPHLAAQAAAKDVKAGDAKAGPAAEQWVCPMHPEVTSAKKDRCTKCGMFLEKRS